MVYKGMVYTEIDIDEYRGPMDKVVIMERNKPDTGLVLLGDDEIGLFRHLFRHPVYATFVEEND